MGMDQKARNQNSPGRFRKSDAPHRLHAQASTRRMYDHQAMP